MDVADCSIPRAHPRSHPSPTESGRQAADYQETFRSRCRRRVFIADAYPDGAWAVGAGSVFGFRSSRPRGHKRIGTLKRSYDRRWNERAWRSSVFLSKFAACGIGNRVNGPEGRMASHGSHPSRSVDNSCKTLSLPCFHSNLLKRLELAVSRSHPVIQNGFANMRFQ
jgi:hypothetical protein